MATAESKSTVKSVSPTPKSEAMSSSNASASATTTTTTTTVETTTNPTSPTGTVITKGAAHLASLIAEATAKIKTVADQVYDKLAEAISAGKIEAEWDIPNDLSPNQLEGVRNMLATEEYGNLHTTKTARGAHGEDRTSFLKVYLNKPEPSEAPRKRGPKAKGDVIAESPAAGSAENAA